MRQMDFLSDGGRRKRFSASFRAVEKTRNVWFSNRDRRSGAIGRVSAGKPLLLAGARISICAGPAGGLLALGRRRGRCLDPRARPPGGAVRNRGPARAGFASRASRGSLGGSVGFSGRAGARSPVRAHDRGGARGRGGSRGRARGGATLERRAKMTRHQCTMSYCTFGMIAAWAIRPADSRSRGLTGSL